LSDILSVKSQPGQKPSWVVQAVDAVETISGLVSQHGAASAAHVMVPAAPRTAPRSWEPKLQLPDIKLQSWLEASKQQLGPALVAALLNKPLP
jgi:hypothetical protein